MSYCTPSELQRFFTFPNMFLKSDWLFTVLSNLLPWLLSNFYLKGTHGHEYRSIAVRTLKQPPPKCCTFLSLPWLLKYGMVVARSGFLWVLFGETWADPVPRMIQVDPSQKQCGLVDEVFDVRSVEGEEPYLKGASTSLLQLFGVVLM